MTKQEKSWILYDVANSAFVLVIITAIMPLFYKSVAAKDIDSVVSTSNWGFTNSLIYLLVAIMAPILVTFADYEVMKKKFLSFFLVLGIMSTVLFVSVDEGEWIKCLVLFSLGCIGFSAANIFYDSFLIDVTEDEKMDWVSSNGFAWGYIGGAIPFLIGIFIIQKYDALGLDSKLTATRTVFVLTAIWWLVFSLPLLRHVKPAQWPPGGAVVGAIEHEIL